MKMLALCLVLFLGLSACNKQGETTATTEGGEQKIGVLLVNHGSHSPTGRQALLDLETRVKDSVLASGEVKGIRTAFMEYTEPSIATRMKEFDAEGYTDVVIVPIFLTVSPHSFDDIPTILGKKEDPKSIEALKIEKIARYTPKARTEITPLLDFTDILKNNIARRVKALSTNPAEEGLAMIAYGDEDYTKEWSALMNEVGDHVKAEVGIPVHSHGWCGHIAHYDPNYTTEAIDKVLETQKRAIVMPVLVAHDEMFQVQIIGDGIDKVKDSKNRVVYKPDAILPDPGVDQWVIDISQEYAAKMKNKVTASR